MGNHGCLAIGRCKFVMAGLQWKGVGLYLLPELHGVLDMTTTESTLTKRRVRVKYTLTSVATAKAMATLTLT